MKQLRHLIRRVPCVPALSALSSFVLLLHQKYLFIFSVSLRCRSNQTQLHCIASSPSFASLLHHVFVRPTNPRANCTKGTKAIEPRQNTKFSLFVQPSSFSTHRNLNVIIIHGHLAISFFFFIFTSLFIRPWFFEVSIFANGLIFRLPSQRHTHCAKTFRQLSVRCGE